MDLHGYLNKEFDRSPGDLTSLPPNRSFFDAESPAQAELHRA
jgi:hypothetical protein